MCGESNRAITRGIMNEELFHDPTPGSFDLNDGQIHVWRVNVDQSPSSVERFAQMLSSDEQERAAQFRRVKDCDRFIVARGSLRVILARYLDREPHQLRFVYGEQGKPALAADSQKAVRFNVSHSQSLALFAVARDCEVGIDLEAVQTDFDVEGISRRYLPAREAALICAAPVEMRHEIFFTCWTLKEAYVKASGSGLSTLLEQIEILPDANSSGMIFGITAEAEESSRWWSHRLPALPGYAAALVAARRRMEVRCWQLGAPTYLSA
jgi:4'-phosphopantetheinyl transferase